MQRTTMKHYCKFCGKCYQRKTYHQKHELVCEFMSKSKQELRIDMEEYEDTPSVRKLYEIVQELYLRNEKLEKRVAQLTKMEYQQRKKLCVLNWLNTNTNRKPEQNFKVWQSQLKIERRHMELIFKYDYVKGMQHILEELLPDGDERTFPICAFNQKENVLYIYDDNAWCTMCTRDLEELTGGISKKVMDHFMEWQDENMSRITSIDSNFSETFTANTPKVMGTNFTPEKKISRIKNAIYKHLKTNLQSTMDCELTF